MTDGIKNKSTLRELLPKRLKMCRENAGLSMHEAAKRLNKTAATVSKWESGDIMPYADTLLSLCSLYNVDITAFFGTPPAGSFKLTPSETELIKLYRNSDRTAQSAVKTVLKAFQIGAR